MQLKKLTIVLIVFAVVAVLWSGMLITDTVKSQNFQEPVFAWEKDIQPDYGSVMYQGLGYTVNSRYYTDENGEIYPEYSEVRLFGIIVSAVIT